MTATPDCERFQSDAGKYAAYLETPEGRLRLDLAFANLMEFIPQLDRPLSVLDLGCGTGATAVRLARLGNHVTVMDSSPAMLKIVQLSAQQAGLEDRLTIQLGDAACLADLSGLKAFDVVLCHNLLEYIDDPGAVLSVAGCVLRDSSSIVSLVVRNRAGEVLKAAVQAGDLVNAEKNMYADWSLESLYGSRVRLFTPEALNAMLQASSLTVVVERGIRVIADYLPSRVSRETDYDQIFELERKLGSRPEFAAIARYTHRVARCSRLPME